MVDKICMYIMAIQSKKSDVFGRHMQFWMSLVSKLYCQCFSFPRVIHVTESPKCYHHYFLTILFHCHCQIIATPSMLGDTQLTKKKISEVGANPKSSLKLFIHQLLFNLSHLSYSNCW